MRSLAWRGPAIIAADFNGDATKTHTWPVLKAAGWAEAHTLADDLQQPTFPTSSDATKIDSILLSPCLVAAVRKVETLRTFDFPNRHPLSVEIDMGRIRTHRQAWKVPRPMTVKQLEAANEDTINDLFIDAFSRRDQDSSVPNGATLENWSAALEDAFSGALTQGGDPGLARSQKGRGCLPVYRKIPINLVPKLARQGDFQPSSHFLQSGTVKIQGTSYFCTSLRSTTACCCFDRKRASRVG